MKKKLNLSHAKENLSQSIGFTSDILLGATVVTIEGDQCLMVENYKGIIVYEEHMIMLQGRKNRVLIEGKRLQIEYYTNLDMKIRGIISSVKFC